ncbi:MAG: palindromic element RPE2 domain-containing protein [Rickettsia endosymbiont of Culicoides impunctatus]|nr:MAG: palindromic element RPE2 domain-containing protein [Rickettsia endosymbiont of Culicoides impunctatus]
MLKIDPASASNFDPLKLQILALFFHTVTLISSFYNIAIVTNSIVNSGEFGARNDGAIPISNRRATSDDVTNFPSIDYIKQCCCHFVTSKYFSYCLLSARRISIKRN